MRTISIAIVALAALGLAGASAQQKQKQNVDAAKVDALVKSAFPGATADWQPRLAQDATMASCSAHDNAPPQAIFEEIKKRELAAIQYPADGIFLGDWKRGETFAQSGYGLRFSDYPPARVNGGNCYACHQLTKAELSFGTIGPSLSEYGKIKKFSPADTKAMYEKIYNPHATAPCSNMPRFGANKILTVDQIKDLVALVMSPDSPVNK